MNERTVAVKIACNQVFDRGSKVHFLGEPHDLVDRIARSWTNGLEFPAEEAGKYCVVIPPEDFRCEDELSKKPGCRAKRVEVVVELNPKSGPVRELHALRIKAIPRV